MLVETPPRGSTESLDRAELEALVEALIEEARRRARRRRLRYAGGVLTACLAAASVYFGFGRDGHGGTLARPGATEPAAPVAARETQGWSASGGPDGGTVNALAAAGNRVYAGTATGIFRSANGGRTWTRAGLDGMQIHSVAVDPRDASNVYAARLEWDDLTLRQEAYASADGGRTWHRLPVDARYLVVDPADPQTIYAAAGTVSKYARPHLFRSTDAGASWQPIDGLGRVFVAALAPDPAHAHTVYAAAGGIFKSADAGTTWARVGTATGTGAVAVDGGTVYAATGQGLLASDDGGLTWQTRNTSMKDDRSISSLTVTPRRLIASTYCAGVLTSADGGRTWRPANAGLPFQCPFTPTAVALTTRGFLVGLERGAYASTDGAHWRDANTGLSLTTITSLVAPAANRVYAAAGTQGLFASTDRGRHWRLAPTRLAEARVVAAHDDTVLVAGTKGKVLQSDDRGGTWRDASAALAGKRVTAFAFAGATAYAGTAADGVFVRDGVAWRPLGPAKTPVAVIAVAGDTIYVGSFANTTRGLYRSTDGGTTWRKVRSDDVAAVVVDPARPASVYVVSAYVFKSTDGGETWHRAGPGLPRIRAKLISPTHVVFYRVMPDWLTTLALDPADPRRLFVGTAHNGVYTSANGGASWQPLNVGQRIMRVRSLQLDASGRTLYAGVEGGGVVSLRTR